MISRHLPFAGLTAFRAAALHKTLAKAGASLNVSQPAMSRRLKELENDLGCPLFDRSTKPVSLTPEGRELLDALQHGFGIVESTTDRLRQKTAVPCVTITGPTGFLNYWFLHRLNEINQAFPDINIKVIDSDTSGSDLIGDIDIRFISSASDQPLHREGEQIFNEAVFAAASPAYLAQRGGVDLRRFTQDLVFLSVDAGDRWYSWDVFFKNLGAPEQHPRRKVEFNSYSLLVNSMLAGHGVGLAWEGLLDTYFDTGALVRLSDVQLTTNRGYYLFLRDDRKASAKVRKVGEWILSAATAEHSIAV